MEETGGEAANGCQPLSGAACQQMVGKLAALTARQWDLQRYAGILALEQEAFLREMRTFADTGQAGDPSTYKRSQLSRRYTHLRRFANSRRGAGSRRATTSSQQAAGALPSGISHTSWAPRGPSIASSGQVSFADQAPLEVVYSDTEPVPQQPSEPVLRKPLESLWAPSEPVPDFMAEAPDKAASSKRRAKRVAARADGNSDQSVEMAHFHLKAELSGLFRNTLTGTHSSTKTPKTTAFCKRILKSQYFEAVIGLIIIVNVVNIGWAIEGELQRQDTTTQTIIEIIIVVIFWAELSVVVLGHGVGALKKSWNAFDLVINSVTTLALITAPFADTDSNTTFADFMEKMLILRLIRLLRLFRAARLLKMSKSLWMLIQGLKKCLGTMFGVLVLLSIALYVFACFGAELITKSYTGDVVVGSIVDRHMSSIPRIMLTLFRFISMDSTAEIYVNLIHRGPWLMIYFVMLVICVYVLLMNLVTAIIVEDAITSATMDKDLKGHLLREKLKNLRPAFVELFREFDDNGDGTVQVKEIVTAINGGVKIPERIQNLVTAPRMLDLFDLLDHDHSGELTESEFVDGMSCLALSEVPLETMQMLHLLRLLRREVHGTLDLLFDEDLEGIENEEDQDLDGDEGRMPGSLVLRRNV